MFFSGIHPAAVPNPDFLGLTDFGLGIPLKEIDLDLQFLRKPEVIRIEKGQPLPGGRFQAPVAGGADSLPGLIDVAQAIPIETECFSGSIGGTVVHHNQLEILKSLRQHRIDGLPDPGRPVESGNDHADQGRHRL